MSPDRSSPTTAAGTPRSPESRALAASRQAPKLGHGRQTNPHAGARRRIRQSRHAAARRGRPPRRRRIPPQPRGDLERAVALSARTRPATSRDRQRHRTARGRRSPDSRRRSPGGRAIRSKATCAASTPGARIARLDNLRRGDAARRQSASEWRLAERGLPEMFFAMYLRQCHPHRALGGGGGAVRRAPAATSAQTGGCSSMAHSVATAGTTRRATKPSMPICGAITRNGACATPPIYGRWPRAMHCDWRRSPKCPPTTLRWCSNADSAAVIPA